MANRPPSDPHRTGALILGAALLCGVILLASREVQGASRQWAEYLQAFKQGWQIDSKARPGVRAGFRAKKREAIKGLRKCRDARAIPLLLKAHKGQLKYIQGLKKEWAKQRAKWEQAQPAMEKLLAAKTAASTDGKISLTPSQKAWVDEIGKLDTLWREATNEEELAEYARKAMARVANTVSGPEQSQAISFLAKATGNGQKEGQLDFIRLFGYVEGDTATALLEKFAGDMQPFIAQAALEALGRQNAPRSIDTLLGRLDDPRWQLRAAALQGLSFYNDPRVVDALVERVATEDGVLKRHYFVALGRILQLEIPGTVEAWTSWWGANREDVVKRWADAGRRGPVKENPPAVMIRSEGNAGATSFYGMRTESKHIIFVIDISGSMHEHGGKNKQGLYRIDVAKRELKNAIRSLSAADSDERGAASFNVVAYAEGVTVFKEGKMVTATKRNKDKAFAWIDKLEAVGATNIYDAVEKAFEIIGTRRAMKQLEKGTDTIFLMTDGKPNRGKVTDPQLIRKEVKKLNRDRKLTIHTIGVGEGHEERFLKELARENGGEYLGR